ncbi:MAG: hypothetical protein MUP90_13205, partial [Gammaproteobacteria bacterium]|nr:hypothetical protein [Gammaproteobacteria bacterium]
MGNNSPMNMAFGEFKPAPDLDRNQLQGRPAQTPADWQRPGQPPVGGPPTGAIGPEGATAGGPQGGAPMPMSAAVRQAAQQPR